MKKDLVQKALNIIQQKKRKAENDYQQQMQPLYADADFQNLDANYARVKIENAKKEAYNQKVDFAQEKFLAEKIESFKKKYNIQPIAYSCKKCNDEGYKNGEMCTCLKREISLLLLQESGFCNLENFDDSIKTCHDLLPLYNLMKQWCYSDFKKNLIYLAGQTGVGKTHLVKCMANELINQNKLVKLATAFSINLDFKLFNKIKDENLLKKYIDIDILIIDDLGTEPIFKNITEEYFYLIINERKMQKKPTIITSNLTLEDIRNRYDERIYSRIVDRKTSITVFLEGQDLRTKK